MDDNDLTMENNGVELVPIWTWKNVPLNIVKKFKEISRVEYGNSYWAALLSIIQKAELYDTLYVKLSEMDQSISYLLVELDKLKTEKKGPEGPKTFGDER